MSRITESYVREIIKSKGIKLLGQIPVDNDNYTFLVGYARGVALRDYISTIPSADLLLSIALVQVAIRHYKEGRFWGCFLDEIGREVSSARLNYLGQIFDKTINTYNLYKIDREDNTNAYVENIKAHAFVTDYYFPGFFEFSFAFYENNLFREISDDLMDDLDDLAMFMASTLSSKKDYISSDGDTKRAAKSYKLLKSTRAVFAQCDLAVVHEMIAPALSLIDKYYYENEKPIIAENRLEKGFLDWCTEKENAEKSTKTKQRQERKLINHKPYISVDVWHENVWLVIPPQKIRNEECNAEAWVEIIINNHVKKIPLELYRSFGLYISEELKVPIPDLFDEININIITLTTKNYRISPNNYRIFNDSWESINKFSKGHNYLLVKKYTDVTWNSDEDLIDYISSYKKWDYYSVNVSDDTVCNIGNKPLSIIGEFSFDPVFDSLIEKFDITNTEGRRITGTRVHPAVSLVVDKEKYRGTILIINSTKWPVYSIAEKSCYEWPDNKDKLAVNIVLEDMLPKEDGYYKVILDVPGETNKTLCEYVLLRKFDCKFDRPRYVYSSNAVLTIEKGGNNIYIFDNSVNRLQESESTAVYEIPITVEREEIEISVQLQDTYLVKMPIRRFMYGFSPDELAVAKEDFIWYADLKENLYVKIPGATQVSAYWGHDSENAVEGVELSPEFFRIDISEIIRIIQSQSKKKFQYINLLYTDNAKRTIPLPSILRNLMVNPYFRLMYQDGVAYTDVEILGKADLYLRIKKYPSEEIVVEKKYISNGKNEFPELSLDEFYTLQPVMEEGDDFGLDVIETTMKPMINIGCIDDDNLVNCRLPVKEVYFEDEVLPLAFDYFLDFRSKIDTDLYEGTMYGLRRSSNPNGPRYAKDRNGKNIKIQLHKIRALVIRGEEFLSISIEMYSKQDEAWMTPSYDWEGKEIIHCDNSILDTTDSYDRFSFLDEYSTFFNVDAKRIRRIKNAF